MNDPIYADDLPPVPSAGARYESSPLPDAAALDPWEEEFRHVCIPIAEAPCPVRYPNGTPGGGPLLLTWSRLAIYHELIGYTGEDEADKPESLTDCQTLLFLGAHAPETWSAETEYGPPLRRSLDRFRAAVDAWADSVFATDADFRASVRTIAAALWEHHCGRRPVAAEKKTTIPENS